MKYSEDLENENVLWFRDRSQWWRYSELFRLQLTEEYWEDYDKAVAEIR